MHTLRIALAASILAVSSMAFAAPKPAPAVKASQATDTDIEIATCRDGKKYYGPTNEHRGACSGHGGVASWSDGTPVKAPKSSRYR